MFSQSCSTRSPNKIHWTLWMWRNKMWKSSRRCINVNIQLLCGGAKPWELCWDIPFTALLVNCEKTSVYSVMFGKLCSGTARTLHSAPRGLSEFFMRAALKRALSQSNRFSEAEKCQFSLVGTRFSPFSPSNDVFYLCRPFRAQSSCSP